MNASELTSRKGKELKRWISWFGYINLKVVYMKGVAIYCGLITTQ